jgi:hypothetical protein
MRADTINAGDYTFDTSALDNTNSIKLVRVIKIDPDRKTVEVRAIRQFYENISNELGGTAKLCHHLPNGSRIYTTAATSEEASFSIGCSQPIVGPALIVGRRGKGGLYTSTFADEDAVASIVEFSA